MPMGHDVELPALEHEVRMDETDQGAVQRDEGSEKRHIGESFAEDSGDDGACREAKQSDVCTFILQHRPWSSGCLMSFVRFEPI